ncbi:PilN domain-containing protein, partial [Hydrogenophaga sp.]|uniref:PilN domain-containing protein n=1 Tax=Hydrogenophaga sp. TaxID=1904254 RepID=UPI003562FECC
VAQLPDGIYLTSMKQENQSVLITGVAQSQERVSELLRNLANNSPWLSRPELVEIVASNMTLSSREQRRVSNFTVRVSLNRPSAAGTTPAAGSPSVAPPAPGKV